MNIKDFDRWNELKKKIHDERKNVLYNQGEIWWCHLGVNVGFEEDGAGLDSERPVVIVRRFSVQLCWVIPLSTSLKNNPYYIKAGMISDQPASAILSQMRPIDTKRLINMIGVMDKTIFSNTKRAAKGLL